DAAPLEACIHVDRILHGPLVGHAAAVGVGVGIAGHLAVEFGHDVREAALDDVVHAPAHLRLIGDIVFVGVDEVGYFHRVDRGDRGDVGIAGIADRYAHGPGSGRRSVDVALEEVAV